MVNKILDRKNKTNYHTEALSSTHHAVSAKLTFGLDPTAYGKKRINKLTATRGPL